MQTNHRRRISVGIIMLIAPMILFCSCEKLRKTPYDGKIYTPTTEALFGKGQKGVLPLKVTNVSSVAWKGEGPEAVLASYHLRNANDEIIAFDNIRTPLGKALNPQESVELDMLVEAPVEPGKYILEIDLLVEGQTWFHTKGSRVLKIPMTVTDRAKYFAEIKSGEETPTVKMMEPGTIKISVTNKGSETLSTAGAPPILASYHLYRADSTLVSHDNSRTDLPGELATDQSAELDLKIDPIRIAGEYKVEVDLVAEGVTWFKKQGSETVMIDLLVTE